MRGDPPWIDTAVLAAPVAPVDDPAALLALSVVALGADALFAGLDSLSVSCHGFVGGAVVNLSLHMDSFLKVSALRLRVKALAFYADRAQTRR